MVPSCGGTWAILLFCTSSVCIIGSCLRPSTSMEVICVHVCVCVCAHVHVRVRVCVHVHMRERERERLRD